ncbi:DNA (cytosine-5-)-methyltransferase [Aeromonas dhakensis]|uniref:DNA cytosine methyltransferase n=1 Tax=Aeromonas TaxID=642 RepID=UPI001248B833|nr:MULTISPECIES: DNA (cytosine-5-)-methyltransferase [Aeromonas]KAB0674574.1 DNA cytosine methyltransferase [Aeromonas veronii]MBS4718625.1 DNA (cytosine-5-)-methyltransferase [Aeromonas dhakensis]
MATLACIDLFCGAGGLTHGLTSEGIPVVAGIDVDPACRHPFETNNGALFIKEDVSHSTPEMLQHLFGEADIRILAGCAPCQPFSTYSQRYDTVGSQRWSLLYEFARLVRGTQPDIVTMENVPTVQKHEVYGDFVTALEQLGYNVWHDIVDCSRYGLPQRRHRMVLLASRLGPIELIQATQENPVTVHEAIGKLPAIAAGGSLPDDRLHTASRLSTLNLERIRASRPGGSWREWPQQLVADCHRRETGRTYPGVYGRMSWNESAPTLTTQFYGFGNGRFGHPEQDRAISLREGAILQGFPVDYSFVPDGEPIRFGALGRMIGNAVPVTLGKVIGRSILKHLAVQPLATEAEKFST